MAYFRVILHGEGVCIQHDSRSAALLGIQENLLGEDDPIIGFYATRLVRGTSKANAVEKAMALIVDEWLRPPLKEVNLGIDPRLSVDSVEEIGLIKYLSSRAARGFTFYTSHRSPEDPLH
jgi:hypothetical protein